MRVLFKSDFEMEEIAPIVESILEDFEKFLKLKKEDKHGKQTNKR